MEGTITTISFVGVGGIKSGGGGTSEFDDKVGSAGGV